MKRSLLFIALAFLFCRMGCNCDDDPSVGFSIKNTLDTDLELAFSGYRTYGTQTEEAVDKTFSIEAGETLVIHSFHSSRLSQHVSEDALLFFDVLQITNGNQTTEQDFTRLSEWDYKDGVRYKLIISEEDF